MPPNTAVSVPDEHAALINQVRSQVKDLISPFYDTKFNILRWLQANEYSVSKTVHQMRKHLKWRKQRKLDEDCSGLQKSEIKDQYASLSILGPNRKRGDRLIVVDQAGKIDINGVMKSVQPTEYVHSIFRQFEEILRQLMKMEEELGTQCYVYLIFDLDGLDFDPSLLGIVNGPFRVSWQLVGTHYREFIDRVMVVNAPSYVNMLWSAFCVFLPENARQKIFFPGSNWVEEIKEFCDADYLPEKYGGTMSSSLVLKDIKPVPKHLYWKPRPGYPNIDQFHRVSIPAGKSRTLIYFLKADNKVNFYNHNEDDITFCVLFSEKTNAKDNELEAVVQPIQKCGLPSIDVFDYEPEQTGYYHLRLTNEASWLLPSTYRIIVHDANGIEIKAVNQNEKWIKQGVSPKTSKK
ncbi:hypothetical protein WR25_06287 [Diploscapter pachys]|uniref:CRAL-TRIO domain-containing protein n=1 Tax=Diploscapter pachys TaxID=2018661 RepID=A0A2A2LSA1_9BILA|nr:hypothetical protein WR25_06287 [Diploscapter pachys]